MLERRSALAGALARGGRDGADGRRRLQLGEVRGWSLVQIAAFPGTMARIESILGAVPTMANEIMAAGDTVLLRIAPDQIWIIGPDASGLDARLQQAIDPADGAVTPLSHGRTRIFIAGGSARDVLMKGVPLDFHPEVFRVGHFALTGLHHTPVLIHRVDDDRYELYALRTFALTLWEWLADAALESGYDIAAP